MKIIAIYLVLLNNLVLMDYPHASSHLLGLGNCSNESETIGFTDFYYDTSTGKLKMKWDSNSCLTNYTLTYVSSNDSSSPKTFTTTAMEYSIELNKSLKYYFTLNGSDGSGTRYCIGHQKFFSNLSQYTAYRDPNRTDGYCVNFQLPDNFTMCSSNGYSLETLAITDGLTTGFAKNCLCTYIRENMTCFIVGERQKNFVLLGFCEHISDVDYCHGLQRSLSWRIDVVVEVTEGSSPTMSAVSPSDSMLSSSSSPKESVSPTLSPSSSPRGSGSSPRKTTSRPLQMLITTLLLINMFYMNMYFL